MSNVVIDRNKIDLLANSISVKSGEQVPMTLDKMIESVDGLNTDGIIPTGTISITENDLYNVTNYEKAYVHIPTVSTNFIEGTFNYASGGTKTISIPYTGSGYPVEVSVVVSDGVYAMGTDWADLVRRYAIGSYHFVKDDMNAAPDYSTADASNNNGRVISLYKNSTTSANSYDINTLSYAYVTFFTQNSPSSSYAARPITMPNATTMKISVFSSNYCFAKDITYTYRIVYSE